MNRLLVQRAEIAPDGRFRLAADDPRARHLAEVLKAEPGARLKAGVVNGLPGEADVLEREGGAWTLRFTPGEGEDPPARWTLLLAMPRPQTLRKVLLAVPQLGVSRLLLVGAARTERSYFHSPLLAGGEWRRHLRAGMEQAGVVAQPTVLLFERLHRLLQDGVDRWLPEKALRLLPHPGSQEGIDVLAGEPLDEAVVAVGPEGGWQDGELRALVGCGFRPLHLGPRILRVETAVHCLCAQLDLLARLSRTRTQRP